MTYHVSDKSEKTKNYKHFSDAVKKLLKEKVKKQSDLVNESCLSKTTVSRICRNSNDKGSTYLPTIQIVMAVCVGLKLTRTQARELLFCAYPEMELWGDFLDNHLTIDQSNEILDYYGFPLLGNIKEE